MARPARPTTAPASDIDLSTADYLAYRGRMLAAFAEDLALAHTRKDQEEIEDLSIRLRRVMADLTDLLG